VLPAWLGSPARSDWLGQRIWSGAPEVGAAEAGAAEVGAAPAAGAAAGDPLADDAAVPGATGAFRAAEGHAGTAPFAWSRLDSGCAGWANGDEGAAGPAGLEGPGGLDGPGGWPPPGSTP
jgi:hypothetical protein